MPERHRILIVDDDALDRQAVVRALRREAATLSGVEADVLEVDTITTAREALGREEFACVFLDHTLPDGTSLDLLLEIRSQGLATPVVVLTGQRDEQTILEVMQAGAVDYLPKERLHPDLVARSLRAALLFHRAEREKQAALSDLRARDRAIAAATNGIVIADPRLPDCPIVYTNRAFLEMTGYSEEEVVGHNCRFLQGRGTSPEAVAELREAVREQRSCQVSILNYRKDGTTFWNEVTVSPVRDTRGTLTHFVGIQTDVTARQTSDIERRRVEEALRRSQEDLQLAVDAACLGTFYCDYPLDKITWNDTCKEHFFLPLDAQVDFTLFYSLLHPDDREPTRQAIERALTDHVGYDVEYRTLAPDGRTRWVNAVGRFYYGPDGSPTRFDGITIDISERRQAQDALRRSEEAQRANEERLQDTQARLEAALSAGGIATWTFDLTTDRVAADANLARLFSVGPEDAAGGRLDVYLQAIHPDDRARVTETIGAAIAQGDAYEAEYRVVLADGSVRWLATRGKVERDGSGQAVSLPGVVLDITERAERGRRERFLSDLGERSRALTDPDAVIADAVRSIGDFLGASRVVFADIDIAADVCTIPLDFCADASVTSMMGRFPISAFGPFLVGEYEAGRTVTVDDVQTDLAHFPAEYVAAYDAVSCRAFIAVPVLHSSRLVSVVAVHSRLPRRWMPEEVTLVQTVVERTWLNVQVLRQQQDLAREAQEQRDRAEREALLNRVGAAIRLAADPDQAVGTAMRELGEAMGVDRCYYAVYDQDADTATIGSDWHRDGLPSLAGQYRMSRHAVNRDPVYMAGRTQVVADTADDPATQALGMQALVRVPLVAGRGMTALSVAVTDGPRDWTLEEVSLVETVATQVQTTLESLQVQRREHRIAQQLQDALQPALPEFVSGLSVGRFTRPALEEASVGGDFFDVFPLDKNLYALVLGDVSGKGLAAAQQLALIRNSLRTTLYLYRSPAQAADALNKIVTSHDLLVGFVTCWVGVYDAVTGEVAYCSCGHEPGLIRRVNGTVEALETTGPPVGVAENAEYSELAFTLSPDDGLLLYTDGVSEAGMSRTAMLGTEGLMRLLAALPSALDTQAQAEALVEQVSAFAGGVFRDDVAVLLARRQGLDSGK